MIATFVDIALYSRRQCLSVISCVTKLARDVSGFLVIWSGCTVHSRDINAAGPAGVGDAVS
jgi:hypothetical protein